MGNGCWSQFAFLPYVQTLVWQPASFLTSKLYTEHRHKHS